LANTSDFFEDFTMDVAILEQLGDEMGLKSAKMSQESGQDEPR